MSRAKARQSVREGPENHLDLGPFLIDCCKDGTLSIRERGPRGRRLWNAALPVYSAITYAHALDLIVAIGTRQYDEHPQMPGQIWYRVAKFGPVLEVEHLAEVTELLRAADPIIHG